MLMMLDMEELENYDDLYGKIEELWWPFMICVLKFAHFQGDGGAE